MAKTERNNKGGFFDFKNMRIQERLQKSYIMVLSIATVAAILGVISVFVISMNYKNAMDNYALPQGDIGQLMEAVAECRSATRGIVGYDSREQVERLVD
jgi:methyl-accepting chemotaxis protein